MRHNTHAKDQAGEGTHIEGELRRLAIGGAAMFLLLIGGLVMVLDSLGSQLTAFEKEIVPTERAVGRLFDSMGEISAREAAVLTAPDVDSIVALGGDDASSAVADEALVALAETLDPNQLSSLDEGFGDFLASANDLTSAVVESHRVDTSFGAKLTQAQAEVGKLLSGVGALQGEVQLRYVLLLRDLNDDPSAEAAGRLIHGSVRKIDERVGTARTMIEVLGRRIEQVALTRDRDELNSLSSNGLAQAAAGARAAVQQLVTALATNDDTELAARADAVSEQLDQTIQLMSPSDETPGLVDLRHAYFDAQANMRSAQSAGQERALIANETLAAAGARVRAMAAASQANVDRVVQTTRMSVTILVLIGVGACVFSTRRLMAALRALRQQNADLATLKDELGEANIHLEARVEERTQALADREASTRLLLDSMGDGIFEVDGAGCLIGEHSKAIDDWFGDRLSGKRSTVWKVLTSDPFVEASIQFGWDQLIDGFLPFEVAADQIPRRFEEHGRVFDVEYRPGTSDSSVLVVVRDWTANEAAERAELESREFQTLVGNLLRDRRGFGLTMSECESLLEKLGETEDLAESKRVLHTLKGNTASFGFAGVSEKCHALESFMADEESLPSKAAVAEIQAEWDGSLHRLRDFMESDDNDSLKVYLDEVDQLCRFVSEARDNDEILEFVATWSLTPASSHLARLERQTHRIAASLAKEVQVVVRDNGIRMANDLDSLWPSLIHVIRNAVDHGLESESDRTAAGKDAAGTISFTVESSNDGLAVEISDDGAGIDETLLRKRIGPGAEEMSLIEVLTQVGLSSKDEVTDLSGRGVGMSAAYATATELGGTFTVTTTRGEGTRFRIEFPAVDLVSQSAAIAA